MIVGLCDTQIGENPPILTIKLTKTKTKKSVKKSADFFGLKKSADFSVCVEIVWWDTSLNGAFLTIYRNNSGRFSHRFSHRFSYRFWYFLSFKSVGKSFGVTYGLRFLEYGKMFLVLAMTEWYMQVGYRDGLILKNASRIIFVFCGKGFCPPPSPSTSVHLSLPFSDDD